jgi:SagB-type dehydrogenase family enzyme
VSRQPDSDVGERVTAGMKPGSEAPGHGSDVSLLDFLKDLDTLGLEQSLRAYRAAKREAEARRRAAFADFGLRADVVCPASLLYHLESRYSPETALQLGPEESAALARSLDYKRYGSSSTIALPTPQPGVAVQLGDAIQTRRSRNTFTNAPIRLHDLSTVLALSAGVTQEGDLPRRAAPSAGALYPIEVYPWLFSVSGVPPGLYHYAPLPHALEFVKPIDGWDELWPLLDRGCEGATPAVVFVLTAHLPRVQAKYGERGYRFALLESGHIAQNILLTATALGLNSLPAGGFFDAGLTYLLGVDGEDEIAVYVILAGHP